MTEHMTSTSKPPSATDSADLDSYLRVHRALRTSAARFARAVAAGEPARAEAQRRWYRGFADEIRCHHHIEDELLFSALAERVATYDDDHRPTLTADHAELDDLLDGLTAALAPDVPHALAVQLANAISEHLQQHLDYEDDEIVPLFARHFTTAEFEDLNQRAIKMTPPRQLLFTAPWMMAQLDEAEQKALLASAPKAMHLLWFVSRGRYARLERRAFGVAS